MRGSYLNVLVAGLWLGLMTFWTVPLTISATTLPLTTVPWRPMLGTVNEMSDESFAGLLSQGAMPPMFIFFSADWCVNCKPLAAKFKHAAKAASGTGTFFFIVNGPQQYSLAQRFNVERYPSFFLVKDGKVYELAARPIEEQTLVHFVTTGYSVVDAESWMTGVCLFPTLRYLKKDDEALLLFNQS